MHTFIKESEKILVYDDGWQDTELSEPISEIDFKNYGMENIDHIPHQAWVSLSSYEIITWSEGSQAGVTLESTSTPLISLLSDFEIVTWSDKNVDEPRLLTVETESFSPMDRLNESDDFEILMWTDDKEFNEEKEHEFTNEQVIDHGKLFKHTLESKEDILDIYVK